MRILLTNDDGIYAQGLLALSIELKKIADVTIVAPQSEQSSVGHGITLSQPIWYQKIKKDNCFFGYAISGTPADCVKFALGVLLKKKPDIIVSGINLGPNDGCSVFYSGTVAGAREGALLGIPAIAVSLASFKNADFTCAANFTAGLCKEIKSMRLTQGTFLNVNVPNKKYSAIRGVKITRQCRESIHTTFEKRKDPYLNDYYWMSGKIPFKKSDLSQDTYALEQGYVTVTPIQSDLTDYEAIKNIQCPDFKK